MKSQSSLPQETDKARKLNWAKEEYQKRIKEAKSARFIGDVKAMKLAWEFRQKTAGISKKEADALLDQAAKEMAGKA